MTRPLRRFDPFRTLDMLSSLWSTAAVAPVSTGAAAAYRTLFTTVRRLAVGRRLRVRLDDADLTLTVTEFDSRLDVRALSVGQLGEVRLAARDILWNGHEIDCGTVVLNNVHMRPTVPPVLVGAPVALTLDVPATMVDDLFAWAAPRWCGVVGDDGTARLHLSRRPGLGHLEVDVRPDGSTLWLQPRRLAVGRARWRLPARTPAYPVRLPELPNDLRLTGVDFAPGIVRLTATVPEWHLELPRNLLEDIITALNAAGSTLNLTRLRRPR